MSSEFRPLNAVLAELKALVESRSSGFLFLVTDDNHAASIRLRNGNIEEVSFSNRHNDEAVNLLAGAKAARARFQPSVMAAIPSKYGPMSAQSIQWLLGEHLPSEPVGAGADSVTAPTVQTGQGASNAQREIVEKVALTFFGPIAALLCDEAFGAARDVEHALQQIAVNLPDRSEADRFLAEARSAVARAPR